MKDIKQIPYTKECAVIINCGTRLCTTLAILSAIRYLDMPLLVVDCILDSNSVDNHTSDIQYLKKLKKNYSFELIELPIRSHGDTLDYLFLNLQTEYICLVDSDVEILNSDAIIWMRRNADSEKLFGIQEKIFGSGFVQVSGKGRPPQENWYHMERMWIPFTYLNVSLIKRAIEQEQSFNIIHMYNDFPKNQKIAKMLYFMLAKIKRKLPKFIYVAVNGVINLIRRPYNQFKPSLLAYDTGGRIYEILSQQGYIYIGMSFYTVDYYCKHFMGITRNTMFANEPVSTDIDDVSIYIKERINNSSVNFDINI